MEGGILAYNGLVAAGPPEAGVFCFPENMAPKQLIAMAWYIEDGPQRYLDAVKDVTQDQDIKAVFHNRLKCKKCHTDHFFRMFGHFSTHIFNFLPI